MVNMIVKNGERGYLFWSPNWYYSQLRKGSTVVMIDAESNAS